MSKPTAPAKRPPNFLVSYKIGDNTWYIYGDGLICQDKKEAYTWESRNLAEAYAEQQSKSINARRAAEGLEPYTFSVVEG